MKIKITKKEGKYTAVIPELHIVDQADTMPELKESLQEAIGVTVEYILEEGTEREVRQLYKIMGKDLKKTDLDSISGVISKAIVKRTIAKKLVTA